ncbi:ribonuclease III [bacterium 210820-DFI.6.37]|nr:ribonuclease III [bacterium 210820-DFI.6.37]
MIDIKEVKNINTAALAYLGDSVYEVAVRKYIMETGQYHVDRLHQIAIRFVRAEGQAAALKKLMKELTEEEQALIRRARNRKITSKPRHADPVTYKLATAFEAFVGYLYLTRQQERLDWFVHQSITIINNGA